MWIQWWLSRLDYTNGLSCPNCGEVIISGFCKDCWFRDVDSGEFHWYWDLETRESNALWELVDSMAWKSKELVDMCEIGINGRSYPFYWAKTEKWKLVFFLRINWEDIKIRCNPFADKSVDSITKKWSSRRKFITEADFWVVRMIIGKFRSNPQEYWLWTLGIFKR